MIVIEDLSLLEQTREAHPGEEILIEHEDGSKTVYLPGRHGRAIHMGPGKYEPRYTNK